ncbi:TetR family transcriptional regulator [Mycolicibacterium fallax]|uniref:TetR family transcriptional regulator n=1 Tax=Mycolicibacterium fallax TaxID=1793 RepID=A0A1X1QXK9_MYCFA|nr:TetR family transcriptional regulator [Mycolicibacterium fallax]
MDSQRGAVDLSARETKRLQTRDRLLDAAIAEFKRTGMAAADVGVIVAAAGVAHGTFYFHFPTKEHVLLELECREEFRIAEQYRSFCDAEQPDLDSALREALRQVMALDGRLGRLLFKDFLATHFSPTRPPREEGEGHPMLMLVVDRIEQARRDGDIDSDVDPVNSAVFFLLGVYALLVTVGDLPAREAILDDYVRRTLRSMQP